MRQVIRFFGLGDYIKIPTMVHELPNYSNEGQPPSSLYYLPVSQEDIDALMGLKPHEKATAIHKLITSNPLYKPEKVLVNDLLIEVMANGDLVNSKEEYWANQKNNCCTHRIFKYDKSEKAIKLAGQDLTSFLASRAEEILENLAKIGF